MKQNLLKLGLLFFLLTLGTISCSSSDDSDPAPTPVTYNVKGYYKMTSSLGNFILLIEDGGKFTFVNGSNFYSTISANIGYGTDYTFVNNVFTGSFKLNLGTGSQYSLTATYNPTTGAFSAGTIGANTSTSGYGTWTAQRVINNNSDSIGLWYGQYNTTPSNTTTFNAPYTMLVEDDTHVVVADGNSITGRSSLAYGTYTVSGNTFTSTYKYAFGTGSQFSNGANFNKTDGKMIAGTWGSNTATSGSGNWYMDKLK
ncbi:Hypothetical lipoprotein precursor [Flavobacterium indicum GPTSA100-9 = DSM 17447]|uniref:Hypothetical lipoprotein n=1 Tax=Flavobacterium indicum (strain DSM 17447 / CIP 109464 / GPTSA100-9) TaxID=1094466 RepID=H8XT06_FLAIG|nr:hypothetical protein [Flavobacterium indicum]CCG53548.1 Hypothetical lipoprotein precursor [Flavobacterium indicum GPTSA100-9 = DSM 17447]